MLLLWVQNFPAKRRKSLAGVDSDVNGSLSSSTRSGHLHVPSDLEAAKESLIVLKRLSIIEKQVTEEEMGKGSKDKDEEGIGAVKGGVFWILASPSCGQF